MTDDDLIQQSINGNTSAFEALLERHYDAIFRIAYRWCEDQSNAQDITQLACIKLTKSLSSFGFQSAFTSWLYTLVINTARDFYKSPTLCNTREEQSNVLEETDLTSTDKHTDLAARKIYSQQILSHIDLLSTELKDAIVLVYANGLNHKQAAKKLGIKESTVSWRIHEARKHLKETFESSALQSAGETL